MNLNMVSYSSSSITTEPQDANSSAVIEAVESFPPELLQNNCSESETDVNPIEISVPDSPELHTQVYMENVSSKF